MKFKNIVALLGLAEIQLHSNFFGGKNFAKLSEEELEKLDAAIEKADVNELETKIAELEKEKATLKAENASFLEALEQALSHNNMKAESTVAESIVSLGKQCKAYGESNNRHNVVDNDGEDKDPSASGDGLVEGYFNPNDSHNKID